LGNAVSRIAKLAENSGLEFETENLDWFPEVEQEFKEYRFDKALERVWGEITLIDQTINTEKTWELEGEKLQQSLTVLVNKIRQIAFNLQPFLPETADKIAKQFTGPKIQSATALFPRLK
jgi:methionyl-tRNA synthetase